MAPSIGYQSRLDLACESSAIRYARGYAGDTFRRWGIPETVSYDALTIVAELATNAVRYAGSSDPDNGMTATPGVTRCTLDLRAENGVLSITFYDESNDPPVLREESATAENGRGLQMVAGLSGGRWGYRPQPSGAGKCVWARISIADCEHWQQTSAPSTEPLITACTPFPLHAHG